MRRNGPSSWRHRSGQVTQTLVQPRTPRQAEELTTFQGCQRSRSNTRECAGRPVQCSRAFGPSSPGPCNPWTCPDPWALTPPVKRAHLHPWSWWAFVQGQLQMLIRPPSGVTAEASDSPTASIRTIPSCSCTCEDPMTGLK